MRLTRQDKVLGAARLIRVPRHLDGAVVGRWLAVNQALGVERSCSTGTVGHAFSDAAAVGVYEPGQVQHLSKWKRAKIKIESGNQHVMAGIEQVASEDEQVAHKLAFVDRNTLHFFADLFFALRDGLENLPWIL